MPTSKEAIVRVLVSVDMEGVAGVVAGEDVRPGNTEYERNRTYMTAEANAAVRGVVALFVGYHGMAGTAHSVLAHTVSGAAIAGVRCNGVELGEIGLNAALAAQHGAVPVLVAGDDTVAAEANVPVALGYSAPEFQTAHGLVSLFATLGTA